MTNELADAPTGTGGSDLVASTRWNAFEKRMAVMTSASNGTPSVRPSTAQTTNEIATAATSR